MTIQVYGLQIQDLIPTITCHAPSSTILGKAAITVYTMTRAYAEDGTLFLQQGDLINALASFGYAQGWLEGGISLGLVSASRLGMEASLEDMVDPQLLPRLVEKVYRYQRLLDEGIKSIEPAPDPESALWKGAREILMHAETSLQEGIKQISDGNLLYALRWFGYGHGWLDVGVRTGIFRITGHRDLFTV